MKLFEWLRERWWAERWRARIGGECFVCGQPSTNRHRAELWHKGVRHRIDIRSCDEHVDVVRRHFQSTLQDWKAEIQSDV